MKPAAVKPNILLVDDDRFTRQLFVGLLRGESFDLQTAANVAEARTRFQSTDFNLVILDQRLPDGNGLDLFVEMRLERPHLVALLITGHADVRDAVRAVRQGLFDYLTKPFEDLDLLDTVIKKALEMDRAYREIDSLRATLQTGSNHPIIISRSGVMRVLLEKARQVAPLDTTVVIEGESGTGKEVLSRYIHALSARAKAPFLELNCGALSESLLEATLFGYEKGAFTSAVKTTPGYFEAADGGTLLLDEIADMSPKLQASLLRVLQERTFARIGSTVQRPSDFRLICATNKALESEMKAGRIRSDLFYRINVVSMQIPPLRERREDIVALALYFLDHFGSKFGKAVGSYAPEAIAALETAHWAGNVRELQNAVERAVVINTGSPIAPADFGLPNGNSGKPTVVPGDSTLPFREAQKQFEYEYFSRLLHVAGGNVSEAARRSGIARQNFYNHVERLGIVLRS